MPSKNIRKQFIPNAYYHLYNRGVEKRKIFMDDQDYIVFLTYLQTYLQPKNIKYLQEILSKSQSKGLEKDKAIKLLRMNNFCESITLLAYCLMPNHFHLLIKQKEANTIDRFMNSLFTRYVMYFNKKYQRVGKLFQSIYKAVPVTTEEQLLHLSRYLHRNPLQLLQGSALQNYKYSSYPEYTRKRTTNWIKTNQILSFFSNKGLNSYLSFVEDKIIDSESINKIEEILLDEY